MARMTWGLLWVAGCASGVDSGPAATGPADAAGADSAAAAIEMVALPAPTAVAVVAASVPAPATDAILGVEETAAVQEAPAEAAPRRRAERRTRPRLFTRVVTTEEWSGPQVATAGFPAVSRDGRTVVAHAQADDYGNASLLFLSTHDGRELRRIDLPQHTDVVGPGPIDRAAMRAINRVLAAGGYRTLPQLDRLPHTPGGTERFAGHGLAVRLDLKDDPQGELTAAVTIEHPGGRQVVAYEPSDDLNTVAVAPSGRFVVLGAGYCSCHCSTWPVLQRLR